MGLTNIILGKQKILTVGNLYSKRDWGDAEEYAKMQYLILQQNRPSDYVIATGKQYTVKKFIELSCEYLGFKIEWKGKGLKEYGYVKKIEKKNLNYITLNQIIIKIDKKYFRPTEVSNLIGDIRKAKKELNWKSNITIKDLIKKMLDNENYIIDNLKKC
jgi:GDPmannose 4,6-dehydratase